MKRPPLRNICARPNAEPTPHQFRTRNGANETQRMRSDAVRILSGSQRAAGATPGCRRKGRQVSYQRIVLYRKIDIFEHNLHIRNCGIARNGQTARCASSSNGRSTVDQLRKCPVLADRSPQRGRVFSTVPNTSSIASIVAKQSIPPAAISALRHTSKLGKKFCLNRICSVATGSRVSDRRGLSAYQDL